MIKGHWNGRASAAPARQKLKGCNERSRRAAGKSVKSKRKFIKIKKSCGRIAKNSKKISEIYAKPTSDRITPSVGRECSPAKNDNAATHCYARGVVILALAALVA